ncbi:hypothetical protein MKX01_012515 [Papaver californicum]|nr:hypothetical protein MKX01_012515 [Papaver californicum]
MQDRRMLYTDPVLVAQKVCAGVYKGVTTSQLDELAAETAAAMTSNHPYYASLAARIVVSSLHKNTKKSFSKTIKDMYKHVNYGFGLKAPLIVDDVYDIIVKEKRSKMSSKVDSDNHPITTCVTTSAGFLRYYLRYVFMLEGSHQHVAKATGVANAVLDGTNSILLGADTLRRFY